MDNYINQKANPTAVWHAKTSARVSSIALQLVYGCVWNRLLMYCLLHTHTFHTTYCIHNNSMQTVYTVVYSRVSQNALCVNWAEISMTWNAFFGCVDNRSPLQRHWEASGHGKITNADVPLVEYCEDYCKIIHVYTKNVKQTNKQKNIQLKIKFNKMIWTWLMNLNSSERACWATQ